MLRPLLLILVTAWAGFAALGPAHAAQPVFPKDSRIGLVLPPGDLKPSTHFTGFEDSARKVTITIFDLPGRAYEAVEQSAFGKKLKGLTVEKRELFSFAGGIGFLITGEAKIGGENVHAWYLLVNTLTSNAGHVAAFIRVHVPDNASAAYPDAAIRAALRSVTFRPPPLDALLKRLPFKLKDMAGFRIMRLGPTVAVLIDGPADDPIHHPYMVISMGRGAPRDTTDQARFSRDLMSSTPLNDLRITAMEPMRITGSAGYEVRADAKGPEGASLALVQWLRFSGSAYLRMIGVVHKQDWDKLFPRFRAVRDGVDLR